MSSSAARFSALLRSRNLGAQTIYSSVPLEALHEDRDGNNYLKRLDAKGRLKNRRLGVDSEGYDVALSSAATARERFQRRQRLIEQRIKICDWSVGIALCGLIFAMLDVELHVSGFTQYTQIINLSNFLRICIISLTGLLDLLIIFHHLIEDKILSTGNQTVTWANMAMTAANQRVVVPLHVLMTVPMFLRLYLVGRFMVLHSDIHQDPSIRAISSFNQVLVDFPFVVKSLLCKRPLSILTFATFNFWVVMTWIMAQCERFGTNNAYTTGHYLLDYAWFEVVTFFAIGYGDIEMSTYCGRSIAILTGLVGAIISSMITVIISQQLLLSLAENRVNQVISESQLSKVHKNQAARVLQWTWRVVRLRKRFESNCCRKNSKTTLFQLRLAQRNLLIAILNFRRSRWELRVRREDEDDVITIQRAFDETENRLRSIRQRQQQLGQHLARLALIIDEISKVFTQKYPNCPKFAKIAVLPIFTQRQTSIDTD